MDLAQLHFLRPLWLLAIPFSILVWLWLGRSSQSTSWESYLSSAAVKALRVEQKSTRNLLYTWALIVWILLIIGAAGPAWVKQTIPTIDNQNGIVVVMDLSPSMLSTDIKPDRVTRARFELLDMLSKIEDGQTGLVAYSASAHLVSPLTDDPNTLKTLLPALSPQVMPEQGSNVEEAIELAQQLLIDAGVSGGQIILMTDGVSKQAIRKVSASLKSNTSLSILGIGGTDPTPIPDPNGGFVRGSDNEIILTQLDQASLSRLASSNRGHFSTLKADDSDIEKLLQKTVNASSDNSAANNTEYDSWQDMGYIFVLLALPIFALLFRKGTIYGIVFLMLAPLPQTSEASEQQKFKWRDLFATKDQQASSRFAEGRYEDAAKQFERKDWSAAANYRNGNYEAVIEQLAKNEDVTSLYNKANALALSGEFERAIEAYQTVLDQQEDHADAAHNRQLVEELLKQQKQQEQQQQGSEQNQSGDQSESGQSQQGQSDADSSESQEQQSKQESDNSENSSDTTPGNEDKPGNKEQASQSENDAENSNSEDTNSLSEQSEQQAQESAKASSQPQADADSEPSEAEGVSEIAEDKSSNPDSSEQDQTQDPTESATLSDSSEQWLRGIDGDPAEFLRRKFKYQAWQQAQQQKQQGQNKAESNEKRY